MLHLKLLACCNLTAHHSVFPCSIPLIGAPNMPRHNTQKSDKIDEPKGLQQEEDNGVKELVLYGDIESLKFVFINSQKKLISTSVSDSVLVKIQAYPGGVSRFVEEAVSNFNGDLRALVEASVKFVDERRGRASEDPARNASVRILPASFIKIQKIQDALATIRGMSRAKILAGLIQLKLFDTG